MHNKSQQQEAFRRQFDALGDLIESMFKGLLHPEIKSKLAGLIGFEIRPEVKGLLGKGAEEIPVELLDQQSEALSVLAESAEKGSLDPKVKADLAKFIGLIIRPIIKDTLGIAEEKTRRLTPDKQAEFLARLEEHHSRKDRNFRRPDRTFLRFWVIKGSLEDRPDLIYSLAKMEETGGLPDLIDFDGVDLIFVDASKESPKRRRDLTYAEAEKMAEEYGVEMMSAELYREMQKLGEFDTESWSWIKASHDKIQESGNAYRGSNIGIFPHGTLFHEPIGGWRGVLRVPVKNPDRFKNYIRDKSKNKSDDQK